MARSRDQKRKQLTGVSIEAEGRDEIDWDRFAWALLQYARILVENDQDGERKAS